MPHLSFANIVLFAILIAAALVRSNFISGESVLSDEGLYLWYADKILKDPTFALTKEASFHHPPLFASILAVSHIIIQNDIAYRIVPYLFYLAGIAAIYALGKRVGGRSLGLLSAFLLAVHPVYFYSSTTILIDVPLTVSCIIYSIGLESLARNQSLARQAGVGLLAAGVFFLKSYGAGVFIVTIIFLSVVAWKRGWVKVLKATPVFLFILFMAGFWVVANCGKLNALSSGAVRVSVNDSQLLPSNILDLARFFMIEGLLIFFLIGMFELRRCSVSWRFILISWIAVFLTIYLVVGIRLEYRFALVFLPPVIIVGGLGIQLVYIVVCRIFNINNKMITGTIISVFVSAMVFPFFLTYPFFIKNQYIFTGYEEAGRIIRDVAQEGGMILAGSERQIRYFSGINYNEYGGRIIAFRHDKDAFEEMIRAVEGQVLVEIDRWEAMQPSWVNAILANELETYFKSRGFRLIHKVDRLIPIGQGEKLQLRSMPVIFIFERPASMRPRL